jgi:hypothetical protein
MNKPRPGASLRHRASSCKSRAGRPATRPDTHGHRSRQETEQQLASVRRLVGTLQNNYGLNDRDIYEHDAISYKPQGEGAGLYRPEPHAVDAPGVQQQQAAPAR